MFSYIDTLPLLGHTVKQRNGAEAPFLPVTVFSFLRPTYLPGSFSGSPYSTPQVSTRTVSMTWSL